MSMRYPEKGTKGTIALDIDGTITDSNHQLPDAAATYFNDLFKSGWNFVFVTGREFTYAIEPLEKLDFPFHLVTQNGADLVKFPDRTLLESTYLSREVILDIESLYEEMEGDFLLYSGFEKGDFCYYRPNRLSDKHFDHIETLRRRSSTPWKAVETFDFKHQVTFPMVKCFGEEKEFAEFERKLLAKHSVETSMILNPRDKLMQLFLINSLMANKGLALQRLMKKVSLPSPLIVAGDDNNDESSIEIADVAIVMETAPSHLLLKADVVAKSSEKVGIIEGLESAISKINEKGER